MSMEVHLTEQALDPWRAVTDFQAAHPDLAGQYGATTLFVGTMRDLNQGEAVQAMTLEHYPAMTQRHLEKVCQEALDRWEIMDALVIHRYGRLDPSDPIVLVAVWSAHRGPAFDACRYIIDELKTRAPFWKQEATNQGQRWVSPE